MPKLSITNFFFGKEVWIRKVKFNAIVHLVTKTQWTRFWKYSPTIQITIINRMIRGCCGGVIGGHGISPIISGRRRRGWGSPPVKSPVFCISGIIEPTSWAFSTFGHFDQCSLSDSPFSSIFFFTAPTCCLDTESTATIWSRFPGGIFKPPPNFLQVEVSCLGLKACTWVGSSGEVRLNPKPLVFRNFALASFLDYIHTSFMEHFIRYF